MKKLVVLVTPNLSIEKYKLNNINDTNVMKFNALSDDLKCQIILDSIVNTSFAFGSEEVHIKLCETHEKYEHLVNFFDNYIESYNMLHGKVKINLDTGLFL